MARLAMNGEPKLRQAAFQGWPIVDEQDSQAVAIVLRSGR